MSASIDRSYGRTAFGNDPRRYHAARPGYPAEIYEILQNRCGLRSDCRTFEVGPGTGLASQKLLELGASPLVLIEPDKRLAQFLETQLHASKARVQIKNSTFEDVRLPSGAFDLGVAASSFHWTQERSMLRKAARLLRSGGWWAMWWHVFRDLQKPSEFQKATEHLLSGLDFGPSWADKGQTPFALAAKERAASLRHVNAFERISAAIIRGSMVFETDRLIDLYATFSPISRLRLAKRKVILQGLKQTADQDFGGHVEIPISTPIYTAQRR
jgi:SAM-dependent methyltransferase